MTPLGLRRATSAAPRWCGRSSENTPHSRTRRAISCEYCPPKSRTTISSISERGGGADPARRTSLVAELVSDSGGRHSLARTHSDPLLTLEMLALGLKRWGDH